MEAGASWQFILLVVLIGMSAFFSASETALMSLSKIRIRHLVEEKTKGAESVMEPTTEPWGQRTCYIADPEGNLIEIGSFNK